MDRPAAIWLVLLILLLVACGDGAASSRPASPASVGEAALPEITATPTLSPSRSMVATPTTTIPPAGCGSSDVVRRIEEFVDAFNRGDREGLATFFRARIEAFSVSDRLPGQATARAFNGDRADAILAYLADRHQHGEQWKLINTRSPYYEATRNVAHYGFDLRRSADDLMSEPGANATGNTLGKGTLHCEDRTLSVWAMNTE